MLKRANRSPSILLSLIGAAFSLGLLNSPSEGATLTVGPGKTYSTIRAAAAAAQAGDLVVVDPGTYTGDVCAWTSPNVTVRCAGPGRAVLNSNGVVQDDKGIWVVGPTATGFTADGFEFYGAHSTGGNGCGIRVDSNNRGWVAIRNCYFHDNQMGILASPDSLLVEHCELSNTVPTTVCDPTCRDGNQHNIYVNTSSCRVVVFRYNYSHGSWVGHQFKSRAQNSYVLYNRLADEDAMSGYTIDIPDGGRAYIIGNLIEQGPNSPNSGIIAYAAESAGNGILDLYVVNNTIVNDKSSGTFIQSRDGSTVRVVNNILYGPGTPWSGGIVTALNNYIEPDYSNTAKFANPASFDYHLTSSSPLTVLNAGVPPGPSLTGYDLTPTSQYVFDLQSSPRSLLGGLDMGAFEYGAGGGGPPPDATAPSAIRDLRNR